MRKPYFLVSGGLVALMAAVTLGTIHPVSAASSAKVNLCHETGKGRFQPINVSASALAAHLGHGDVQQPNGAVPGGGGFVFDASCAPVSWGYGVNVSPDPSAQNPASPGNLFAGSGIPATNFGTARNEGAGIELGLMTLYRQGPTVMSLDDYADGVLNFSVASGPQSVVNGSFLNNANRAAWNFTYSVATGLNGATTDLSDHTFQLLYDVDPGAGATYRTLSLEAEVTPQAAGQSGFQWRDQGTNLVFIVDDKGNVNVTQNSQNYVFGFFQLFLASPYGPANSFAGPATFDIILQALDGAQIVVRNHIAVNVAP